MQPAELRSARNAAGLTQEQLANSLGVSRELINRMEAGRAKITKRTANQILGVTTHHTLEKLCLLSAFVRS